MSNKSATDLLLELISSVDLLNQRYNNTENLLKILLQRINTIPFGNITQEKQDSIISNPVSNDEWINKDNFDSRKKTNKFSELAAQHGITVEKDSIPNKTVISAKQVELLKIDDELIEDSSRKTKTRGQKGSFNNKKSSVSQVLQREDGSALFLANIEIFDINDKLINQSRTNTKGRWLMALDPGDYKVHVLKRFPPDSGKQSIDTSYQVTIPPSDKPLELDPLIVSG